MSQGCPNLSALQAARASLKQSREVDLISSLNLYKATLEVMPAPVPATEQEKTAAVRIVQVLYLSISLAVGTNLTFRSQQLYLHYVAHVRPNRSAEELEPFAKVIAQIMDRALLFADLNEVGDEQEWGKRFRTPHVHFILIPPQKKI